MRNGSFPFWLKFQAIVGGDVQARFYEAFHFHDNEPSANELASSFLSERSGRLLGWRGPSKRKTGHLSSPATLAS